MAQRQARRPRGQRPHVRLPWKGTARHKDVVVDGEVNRDAAWYYPDPSTASASIRGRVAFWKGVTVEA